MSFFNIPYCCDAVMPYEAHAGAFYCLTKLKLRVLMCFSVPCLKKCFVMNMYLQEMDEHMRSMLHHRELENLKGR